VLILEGVTDKYDNHFFYPNHSSYRSDSSYSVQIVGFNFQRSTHSSTLGADNLLGHSFDCGHLGFGLLKHNATNY